MSLIAVPLPLKRRRPRNNC
jgi:predicted nucleic acid-binding protein